MYFTIMFTVQGKKCKSKLMMTNADFLVVRGEKKGRNVSGNRGFFGAKSQEKPDHKKLCNAHKKGFAAYWSTAVAECRGD